MKNLTVTIAADQNRPLPAGFKPFAGLMFKIADNTGAFRNTPVEQKLIWNFAGLREGAQYVLQIHAVDTEGKTIQQLETIELTVPGGNGVYWHVTGAELSWADQAA